MLAERKATELCREKCVKPEKKRKEDAARMDLHTEGEVKSRGWKESEMSEGN